MLDMRGLRKAVLFRLFDALIFPVVSYGSQVWLPTTVALQQIISALQESSQSPTNPSTYLPKLATDPIEGLHLSFLKGAGGGLWVPTIEIEFLGFLHSREQ